MVQYEVEEIDVHDNVRDALIESTIGLFGVYRNKEGKEFICHNGEEFQTFNK